jgi:hypothetical protein
LFERVGRLRTTRQLIDSRQQRIKNALREHTHTNDGLQAGAEISAAAKPKKKANVASDAARLRVDIPCLTTLQVVGLEGKKGTAFKWLALFSG